MVLSITAPALAQEITPPVGVQLRRMEMPPYPASAAVADRKVSVGMQTLIDAFVSASIRMAATDLEGDAEGIGIVARARTTALVALVFHAPENLTELSAKLAAITEFSEDTERFAFRALVEDMNHLAEAE